MGDDRDRISLQMPEQIDVSYELAGLGSRFVAALIDTCIVGLIIAALAIAVGYLRARLGADTPEGWVAGFIIIFSMTLIYVGYYLYFEMASRGQSPGKRASGLRVISVDGSAITLDQSAVRNILRVVDTLPPLSIAGVIAIFLTRRMQRLGDLAAGTMVVKERLREMPEVLEEPLPDLPPEVTDEVLRVVRAGVRAVSREEVGTIRRFLERRFELAPEARASLAAKLAGTIRRRFPGLPAEQLSNPELFLEVVLHVIETTE